MAPLRHHDVIRLSGAGPRTPACDWLGGHAGGYLLQHSAKKRIFVIAITSPAQRRRSSETRRVSHVRCSASMISSRTQPRQRGASLRSWVVPPVRQIMSCKGHLGSTLAEPSSYRKAQVAFRSVLLTTFCSHLDGDGSDGDDCRGGMRLCHFRANSVAISLILTPAAVAVLSAALWAARAASRLRTFSNASIGVLGLTMRSFLRL
jgi:hypothetical protein